MNNNQNYEEDKKDLEEIRKQKEDKKKTQEQFSSWEFGKGIVSNGNKK